MLCHKLKLLIGKNRDSCSASSDTPSKSHIDWTSPPQSSIAPASPIIETPRNSREKPERGESNKVSPNGALSTANLTKRDI